MNSDHSSSPSFINKDPEAQDAKWENWLWVTSAGAELRRDPLSGQPNTTYISG